MAAPLALLEITPPAARLTLNRPEARNALSLQLLSDLHAQADELGTRADVTVAVVTGAGKAFCAGMDLRAVVSDGAPALPLLQSLSDLCLKLRRLPMLLVARVNGAAIGGGCGLSCVCDFAVTHADSKMGFPEVDLGVCPAVVAPWLVRRVGAGRARTILLAGGLMTGQQAFEAGMVTAVVGTVAELDGAVEALVQRLVKGGPSALRATKALLNELDGSLDELVLRRGAELSARVLATPEAQELLRARLARE